MGWQDAPVVTGNAWSAAPLVGAAPPPEDPSFASRVGNNVLGEGEILGAGIANIPHAAGSSVVDLYRRLTGGDTNAPEPGWLNSIHVQPGAAAQQLAGNVSGLTTPSGSTTLGQGVGNALSAADQQLGRVPVLQDIVHETGGVAGDVLNLAPAAGLAGKAVGAISGAKAAAAAEAASPPSTIVQNLRAMGIKLRPSDAAKAGPPGSKPRLGARALEGGVGSPELGRDINLENIVPLQARAANYIGADLSKTEGRFKPKTFDDLAAPHNAVYGRLANVRAIPQSEEYGQALSSISTRGDSPETAAAIEKLVTDYADLGSSQDIVSNVRTLRKRATDLIQSENPEFQQRGFAAKKIANAMDSELARRADAAGETGLAADFNASRAALAKIHTIEDSTTAGIIDPHKVVKAEDNGIPIEGDAKAIAYAARYAPDVTRHPNSYKGASPSTVPTSFTTRVAQGLVANIGARKILNGPYQNALGRIKPDTSLPDFFPPRGAPATPRGPVTDAGRLLPAPGEEWMPPTPSGNESLNATDQLTNALMASRHPGAARPAPQRLALPSPSQVTGGATGYAPNAASSMVEPNAALQHPGYPPLVPTDKSLSLLAEALQARRGQGGYPLHDVLSGNARLAKHTRPPAGPKTRGEALAAALEGRKLHRKTTHQARKIQEQQ